MNEVVPPDAKFTFTFDGENIEARRGQSVAAAILNHGVRILRRTRITGKPRTLFCGIGVCFDCLVVINGVPNQRSCLVEAEPGQRIEIEDGGGS